MQPLQHEPACSAAFHCERLVDQAGPERPNRGSLGCERGQDGPLGGSVTEIGIVSIPNFLDSARPGP